MKGKQRKDEPLFACVRLEDMIPADHILRKIDRWIDFSVVHDKTEGLYSHTGRPSIDPEVMIRMLVVGYLNGITSEKRLCQEVHLNLAYRWFCGLSLEDRVPDRTTFSKNRYGRFAEGNLFRELFCDVVRQARDRGLVRGKHLGVDATTVDANASLDSLEPIEVSFDPEGYLKEVEEENSPEDGAPQKTKKYSNETHQSRTDPDSRLLSRGFEKTRLAYSDNILVDNGSRVIVDVEVTEPNLRQEGQVAGEMVERSRFLYGIEPQTLGGDKAYGAGAAVRRICEAGVEPHVSLLAKHPNNAEGIFGKKDFRYDPKRDELVCPAGKRLRRRAEHKRNRQTEYVADVEDCSMCSLKPQCTRARYRVTHRHWDKEYLDFAERLRDSHEYRVSQRCRKKVEHLFAEAKELMGLRKARRRGYTNVEEQCLMTAMVQNMKRIVRTAEARPGTNASEIVIKESMWAMFRSFGRRLLDHLRPWASVVLSTT